MIIMRKKEILKTNNELFARNEELLGKIEDLKSEISDLKEQITSLSAEKDKIEAKLNATKPLKTLEEKITSRAAISKETEYGAEVIGRIVVKAAKYCNSLTASGNSEITKEQINLILGRTEVAKSEILKVIENNSSLDEKKTAVNSLEQETYDYFQSIMAQSE